MKKQAFKSYNFYGFPLLSGLLLFLSFPKIDMYMLAWIALIPLLFSLHGRTRQEAFNTGFFFGVVYFFSTTYWIYHAIHVYGYIPFLPSVAIVLLLSLYLSLYPAVFAVLYVFVIKKSDLPALFLAPVLWTALELIRSYAFTGFPWSSLGYSQYRFLSFIQIADITGVYGISFLLVAFNGAVVDVLLLRRRQIERPLHSHLPLVGGITLLLFALIGTFSYGFYKMNQEREGSFVNAALIQGNIEQDQKWEPVYQNSVISTYKELTLTASKENPDIIIWPETAVPFFFGSDKELSENLVNFQRQINSYLLFGSVLLKYGDTKNKDIKNENKGDKEPGLTNSVVLLDKDGNISYVYDKLHLVPFGEYVPLRNLLFFIDKLVVGAGDYIAGDSYNKAVTPFGSFGTLICYEVIFPGLVRKFYIKGGDFIVTITNDAWFGNTNGPYQHFSMSVFRAVENRKPVLRAANTGISGFIDSSGRILDKTDLFEKTVLTRKFRTDSTLTLYTKYGDIFSYLCIVSSLLLLMKRK